MRARSLFFLTKGDLNLVQSTSVKSFMCFECTLRCWCNCKSSVYTPPNLTCIYSYETQLKCAHGPVKEGKAKPSISIMCSTTHLCWTVFFQMLFMLSENKVKLNLIQVNYILSAVGTHLIKALLFPVKTYVWTVKNSLQQI